MNEPWYVKSFQEDYLKIYSHRSDEAAKEEINRIMNILTMKPNSHVLDLCCGNGRHSRQLAALGYQVTGVDLSATLLEEARNRASEEEIRYIQSDVREIHFVAEFDYVLNLFTSFGYFEDKEDNRKVFEAIQYSLKRDGEFLIDFLNPGYVQNTLVPYSERRAIDITIIERRRIDGRKVIKDIEVIPDTGEKRTYQEQVNLFTIAEMESMLSDSGLTVEKTFGSFEQEPYNPDSSPRMLLVGKK